MKCRNCGEEIRRIESGEGYDLREYQWTHEAGGLLCDLEPPHAEPSGSGAGGSAARNQGEAVGFGSANTLTVCGGGGSVGPVTISGGSGSVRFYLGGGGYVPPEPVRLSPQAEHLARECTGSRCRSGIHLGPGSVLTSADPEPLPGTIVRDHCGLTWERDWDGGNACWSHPGGDGDHETWTKVGGNYGPVTVLEVPE